MVLLCGTGTNQGWRQELSQNVIPRDRRHLLDYIRRQRKTAGGRFSLAAVQHETGEEILMNPDDLFASASVIKIPVLAALWAATEERRLDLDARTILRKEDLVGGSGVLCELHPGIELTLRDLAHLMIVVSDNTATNMLIERIGLPFIEDFLAANGFHQIKLQRKLYDLEARKQGRDNLINAREIRDMLHRLSIGNLPPLSEAGCNECLEIMKRQQHRDKIPALLPKEAEVASKPGSLDDVTHDAAVVRTGQGASYSLVVLWGDFDNRRRADNAIARISRRIYDYVNSAAK